MTRTQATKPEPLSRPALLARLKRLIRELDETIREIEADAADTPARVH